MTEDHDRSTDANDVVAEADGNDRDHDRVEETARVDASGARGGEAPVADQGAPPITRDDVAEQVDQADTAPFTSADWIALGVILAIALIVRVVYWVQSQDWPYIDFPISDGSLYLTRARGVLTGEWPLPAMAHSQGPLYPYLLAGVLALTDGHRLMILLQLAVGCVSIGVVFILARRLAGLTAAIVASVLCIGYGPMIANEGKLLTESLATLLSLMAVLALSRQVREIRWSWLIAAGIALGLASLLRPSFMLTLPVLAVWLLFVHRRELLRAAVAGASLCAVGGLMIAPFTWQNYRAEGVIIPISSAGGITFFLGNNPTAAGTLSFGHVISGGVGTQNEEQLAMAERVLERKLNSAEASTFWYKRGLRFIAEHPRHWAWIMWRKLRLFFSNEEVANVYAFVVEQRIILVLKVLAVPFGLIAGPGLVGAWLARRQRRAQPILLVLGLGFITCMAFYTSSRFRLPMVPLTAVLAGVAVARVAGWFRRGAHVRAIAASVVAIILVALMSIPVGPPLPSPERFGRRNLASMLARAGEPDRGRTMLEPELDPNVGSEDRSEAYLTLGRLELEQSRFREAVDALRKCLEIDPNPSNVAPRRELAKAYYQLGRFSDAIEQAELLLRRNRRDLECRVIIGQCHFRRKQWSEAIEVFHEAHQMAPKNPVILFLLGQAYANQARYDEAVDALAKSVALDKRPAPMLSLAYCLSKSGKVNEARGVLVELLKRDPENQKAKALLIKLGGAKFR